MTTTPRIWREAGALIATESRQITTAGCDAGGAISAYEGTSKSRSARDRSRFAHDFRQRLQTLLLLEGMLAEIVKDGRARILLGQLEEATASISNWVAAYFAGRNTESVDLLSEQPLEADFSRNLSPCQHTGAYIAAADCSKGFLPTVFIVDDDRDIRETISSVLRANGYATQNFADGFAFLKAHSIGHGGCLLVDACMPAMDGFQVIDRLSGSPGAPRVVMMTGQGDIKMAVRAMKAGAVDFLEKPFDLSELLTSIARAFDPVPDRGALLQLRLAAQEQIAQLTERQREVLNRVLSGHSSKKIAGDLFISQRTVDNHRAAIMRKTGARSLPALLRVAVTATCG